MVIPEVNPEHFELIPAQKKRLGTKRGFIAVKPNCSIQSYVPALYAWRQFEPEKVVVSLYQAISGAGKNFDDWPEMRGNIIPFIGGGEEEKSEQEPLRIFGKVSDGRILKAEKPAITSQCIRVPVLNGHLASVFIDFKNKPSKEELIQALKECRGLPQELGLPSAPKQFIRYLEENVRRLRLMLIMKTAWVFLWVGCVKTVCMIINLSVCRIIPSAERQAERF